MAQTILYYPTINIQDAFRAKIRELETNIYNADSPELIRHYETQFIEEWQQCSQDYYKALKDSRITFFLSSLVSLVGIPFVGQQLSAYIGQDVITPYVWFVRSSAQRPSEYISLRHCCQLRIPIRKKRARPQ